MIYIYNTFLQWCISIYIHWKDYNPCVAIPTWWRFEMDYFYLAINIVIWHITHNWFYYFRAVAELYDQSQSITSDSLSQMNRKAIYQLIKTAHCFLWICYFSENTVFSSYIYIYLPIRILWYIIARFLGIICGSYFSGIFCLVFGNSTWSLQFRFDKCCSCLTPVRDI